MSAMMEGMLLSVTAGTGTAAQPQYLFGKNGTTWIRVTNTWGSSGVTDGAITAQTWELSTNSGSAYDTIATMTYTYDGSGNLTATTGGGSWASWIMAKTFAPLKIVIAAQAAHAALTGTSAHGLGTMSTQDASAVAITGGTINVATIGASTPASAVFTRANELFNTYTPANNAAQALDWSKGGSVVTTTGTNALTFSNVPTGVIATHYLEIDKFDKVTWPGAVNWGAAGVPTLGSVYVIVTLVTTAGSSAVAAALAWNA